MSFKNNLVEVIKELEIPHRESIRRAKLIFESNPMSHRKSELYKLIQKIRQIKGVNKCYIRNNTKKVKIIILFTGKLFNS